MYIVAHVAQALDVYLTFKLRHPNKRLHALAYVTANAGLSPSQLLYYWQPRFDNLFMLSVTVSLTGGRSGHETIVQAEFQVRIT